MSEYLTFDQAQIIINFISKSFNVFYDIIEKCGYKFEDGSFCKKDKVKCLIHINCSFYENKRFYALPKKSIDNSINRSDIGIINDDIIDNNMIISHKCPINNCKYNTCAKYGFLVCGFHRSKFIN